MSTSSKHPLHEILSLALHEATKKIAAHADSDVNLMDRIHFILSIFDKSKLRTDHAHAIAAFHFGLPTVLEALGHQGMTEFAAKVLENLKNRQDEPQDKSHVTTYVGPGGDVYEVSIPHGVTVVAEFDGDCMR